MTDYGQPTGREQGGPRPVVVMSGRAMNDVRMGLVFTVPLTTTERGWPSHIEIAPGTGLDKRCWAMVEQFRAMSVQRLTRRIGWVEEPSLEKMRVVLTHLIRA
ncbi:type II toxin-antitoxin system PemK/MazF family toxin [Microbispora sp. SCL1-1]|nr:type II toxin-antitoxin system PemK/MazF family toxin [Microbispora sp. CL1-1]TQS16530.1 type II toxin-antitoxin system PemK/MazF family toxin [Microbispora sp. SCL1-1]